MNYTNEICSVCKEKFSENDDIVVCPVCGSPHHRECYKMKERCENEEFHSSGFRWKKENHEINNPENKHQMEVVFCENCGTPNMIKIGENEIKCSNCQVSLNLNNENNVRFSFSERANIEKSSEFEQSIKFVHSNVLYYLPVFTRFKLTGGNMSFNLICFIFPPLYFAGRKMWFWAIFTAVLSVLLVMPFVVMTLVGISSEPDAVAYFPADVNNILNGNGFILRLVEVCNFLDMIMRIMCCLFGNRLYYNFVNKSLKKLKIRYGKQLNEEILASSGGVSFFNMLMILTMIIALFYVVLNLARVVLPVLL